MNAMSFSWIAVAIALTMSCELRAEEKRFHVLKLQTPTDLQSLLRYSPQAAPLISAHRGGAGQGLPENCIATFEATISRTFSMLEIDPRLTSDGEVVVLHDATLDRTTNGHGAIKEQTWPELKKLLLRDTEGKVTKYVIPTLDEVLEWARDKTVLVLDQKDVPLETRIKKIEEHRAEGYAMLIVSNLKDAQTCFRRNPNIMMEFMMGDRQKFEQFDASGIPWSNIVAFVGHTPPADRELLEMIHAKGASCMAGTSRNIDREFLAHSPKPIESLEPAYRSLLEFGVDIIETDIPREVGELLLGKDVPLPAANRRKYFQTPN